MARKSEAGTINVITKIILIYTITNIHKPVSALSLNGALSEVSDILSNLLLIIYHKVTNTNFTYKDFRQSITLKSTVIQNVNELLRYQMFKNFYVLSFSFIHKLQ